ncbi:cysteine hydrolase family protein [Leifsonia sp. AG29]|uniref:cysteine hydrolase family protein n=1 Tax=Leifsonia sp. AG29 TaxID=2598860 RepID=UPI00131EA16E|nr:isochorismatase family cysteine hydrolase [Leifsonia sp. AG29]
MNDLLPTPATTALLLMDLQNGIVSRHPDVDGFVSPLVRARDAARAAGLTVGYVRVALTAEEASTIPPTSRFAGAAERLNAAGPGTQIIDAIAPAEGDIVVRKKRVGPFGTTDLKAQLDARGIDTLVLAGVATSGVVLTTVRDASDMDYRIVVLEDGCWDSDPEVHRVLTEKVFPRGGATVTTVEEFLGALG